MTDIRVPITAAQFKRLTTLTQNANAAAALRDNVLSALVEGVVDRELNGYSVQINEKEIVLTPGTSNGVAPLAQADVMSP